MEPRPFPPDERNDLREWAALVAHELATRRTLAQRARVEQALQETEWRFQQVVEHIRDVVWLSTVDDVLFVSPPVEEVLGHPPSFFQQTPRRLLGKVHPADRARVVEQIRAVRDGASEFTLTFRYRHPDGSIRWIRSHGAAVAVEDGQPLYAGVTEDVTERKRRASELRDAYQRLHSYIQHSPLAFIEFDGNRRIRRWSDQAASLFGWSEDETLGLTVTELGIVHPDDIDHVMRQVDSWVPNGEPGIVIRNRNLTKGGDVLHCVWYSALLTDEAGAVTSMLSLVEDVTEQVRHQQDLVAAREKAEESNRLKSAFLANMSHEIRTPLSSIIGFAEVLSDRMDGELGHLASLIQQGGTRLMDTLNSVLDLAQISSESIELMPEPGDVRNDVQSALNLMAGQTADDATSLHVQLPDRPVRALLDHAALGRVLTNLVSNAVKFSDRGRVTVTLASTPTTVRVRVEDTGIGIAPDFRAHVFDEFRQESGGMRRKHEGTGLGLAITKHLVTLMGGTIHVGSTQGVGTVFTVRLPRTPPVDDAEACAPDRLRPERTTKDA